MVCIQIFTFTLKTGGQSRPCRVTVKLLSIQQNKVKLTCPHLPKNILSIELYTPQTLPGIEECTGYSQNLVW